VKETANDVLEILRTEKDVGKGSMNRIGKLVEEQIATKFDFNRMSRAMLGPKWNLASQDEQDHFINEFRSLLIRTYSSALSKFRDQTIAYKPFTAEPGNEGVIVKTQIIQQGESPIPLNYSLEKVDGAWKVYDVSIDGLSLVSAYRGQFVEELKLNGIAGVIQKLSEKNRQSS
jgi:phospholipid transport system substrate-binding protein